MFFKGTQLWSCFDDWQEMLSLVVFYLLLQNCLPQKYLENCLYNTNFFLNMDYLENSVFLLRNSIYTPSFMQKCYSSFSVYNLTLTSSITSYSQDNYILCTFRAWGIYFVIFVPDVLNKSLFNKLTCGQKMF